MLVLTFVAALKGLHRMDIMRECNSQKFCTLCDKQVIASALRQLRINFTCIFQSLSKIALVASQFGQFWENFEKTREIILNYPWAHNTWLLGDMEFIYSCI